MKEAKEKTNLEEDETVELNIEDITAIQGGIDDDDKDKPKPCGLGCFIGAGGAE